MKKTSLYAASILALAIATPALADDDTNLSNIDQVGTALTANVQQLGDGNTNTSDIDQGLNSAGDQLQADVIQYGDAIANTANVVQDDSLNTTFIEQNGAGGTINIANSTQNGDDGYAWIRQNGTTNYNEATIMQTGTGAQNQAMTEQGGMNNSNISSTTQNGGGLTANVVQN